MKKLLVQKKMFNGMTIEKEKNLKIELTSGKLPTTASTDIEKILKLL